MLYKYGFLEERKVKNYMFRLYDEDRGFLVEIWKGGKKLGAEFWTCPEPNCEPTDDDLMKLVEKVDTEWLLA
jgi:hypothetical protein